MTDTFAIGSIRMGNFKLWVTHNLFLSLEKKIVIHGYKGTFNYHDISTQLNLEYYEVSLVELKKCGNSEAPFYIDLVAKLATHDSYFNFSRPVKGLQDEKELQFWSHNKSMGLQMPLWNLRKVTVQRLTNLLQRLAEDKISLLGT